MLQSLQNKILFSQCQGLKQALVVVCHFLNVHQFWSGPLKDLPTKTRTQQFSGVSSSRCSHTFRALFNHAKFICHVLYVHLTLISAPCWLAKTDSPVNEGREHCMWNSNSLNKFPTHDFLIISTTNFIFNVNESVINMFYTLVKYN